MLTGLQRDARISDCGRYRWTLTRLWGPRVPGVVWIMLNPSTADGLMDDPTIRRCMKFTQRFGYDGLVVVNLLPRRTPNPDDLVEYVSEDEAARDENATWVRRACHQSAIKIAAWGSLRGIVGETANEVGRIISEEWEYELHCLGTTKDGSPRHPLYVRADAPIIPWRPPSRRSEERSK